MNKEEFRQLMKDYFTFTRSERNGMRALCLILLVAVILNGLSGYVDFKKPVNPVKFLSLIDNLKGDGHITNIPGRGLFVFDPNVISGKELDSLDIPLNIKNNLIRYRLKGGLFRKQDDMRKLYSMTDSIFSVISPFIQIKNKVLSGKSPENKINYEPLTEFDPNSVSEKQLLKMGFSAFQTRNLLNYRNKGGTFHKKGDILKVYGLDSLFYEKINQWIVIKQGSETRSEIPEIKVIELNLTDSVELTSLPGIGPVFAGRIIRYRQILGGFSSTGQLLEVYGMTEDKLKVLGDFITADQSQIDPIRLNFADYRSLNRHPYISGDQARKIIEWRSANGAFIKKEVLLENGIFDTKSFEKVEPYLTCQ
jgi:DNA uptake protein ComE-like DNA-binding protein